jgi:hypothetical protein
MRTFSLPFMRLRPPSTLPTLPTLSTVRMSRIEVRPPSLRHEPSSAWRRLAFWLFAPAPRDAAPRLNRLPAVQDEFLSSIADVRNDDRARLALRVGHARSLRELWHMRIDVYNLVATHHSEFEAAQRLSHLNRHFPTRAPRSGFAPLM